jgi:uncharacterized protein YbbK (DUF523 family)
MCHKTHHQFSCGCTKLKVLAFCTWVDDAEYLVADIGMRRNEGTMWRFDAIMLCKVIHGFETPRRAVRFQEEDDAWIHAEVQRLKDSCERDTVDVYEDRERACVLCASAAAAAAAGASATAPSAG